jgi:hypothetical protein
VRIVVYLDNKNGVEGFFSNGEFLELLERLGVDPVDATEYLERVVIGSEDKLNISLQLNVKQFAYLQVQFQDVDT